MTQNIFIVYEEIKGEFECRGETYSNLTIYDLDKLNQLSKEKMESGLADKISKDIGEEIEPLNDIEWSFEDIRETIEQDTMDDKDDDNYTCEEVSLLLNNENVENVYDFYIQNQNNDSNFEMKFTEKHLPLYFSKEELEECDITEQFKFKKVVSLSLNNENYFFSKDDKDL